MTPSETDPASLADPTEGESTETAAEVVEFTLGEEVCAIDICAVDSIVETKRITRIPRAPAAVEGVMDLRGETTAVVDPKAFLSIEGAGAAANVLVLDRDDDKQKIGIRVDEVTEVASYAGDRIDRNGDLAGIATSAFEAELVKGVLRKHVGEVDDEGNPEDVELVLWIDIEALVAAVADGGDEPAEATITADN